MRDFKNTTRIVVKIGTNTLTKDQQLDGKYVASVAGQVSSLVDKNIQVLIVSSGAIGMGAGQLKIDGPVNDMKMRQACAATGR